MSDMMTELDEIAAAASGYNEALALLRIERMVFAAMTDGAAQHVQEARIAGLERAVEALGAHILRK